MSDRTIILKTPQLQALLRGATQLRLPCKSAFKDHIATGVGWSRWWSDKIEAQVSDKQYAKIHAPYQPGDRLLVKETWRAAKAYDGTKAGDIPSHIRDFPEAIQYEADGRLVSSVWGKRRPSVTMPKWAVRLKPIVKSVRVERDETGAGVWVVEIEEETR